MIAVGSGGGGGRFLFPARFERFAESLQRAQRKAWLGSGAKVCRRKVCRGRNFGGRVSLGSQTDRDNQFVK